MKKIHIIAEAGTNHNGNLQKAINLADIAQKAGADSVKYQIIYPWGLYLPGDYWYGHYNIRDVIKIREEGMLKDEDYSVLNKHCLSSGISFAASVFDEKGLDLLLKLNPPYIKIASCDLNNIRFLRQVAERKKKIVLSTGMSSLQDIEKTLTEISKEGNADIVLLHCVSVYPAKLKQTNLPFISELKHRFGTEIGFSDHTGDSTASCIALSLGATWFEKHFTEDKEQKGFDHAYALDENELKDYVMALHDANFSLFGEKPKITDEEAYTRRRARRSIYASRKILKGEIIRDEDVLVVRPEGKMNADDIDLVIGSKATVDIEQYQAFELNLVNR
ncbi:N-acetylneuraminate synthase family protein [Peredibacter starrii]|uniref:N-acetylneuraminate synthase family protein n=1 Tax=Peredibacter starrii TaxID=28202 RepID=A0AAX4HR32_9BACT|nr:N-acetylneuraminate synthase family protein [Peredibacter starrii]WPU65833.1 N-acetylneuraminate synthase family protein [Peredibacter starrii]